MSLAAQQSLREEAGRRQLELDSLLRARAVVLEHKATSTETEGEAAAEERVGLLQGEEESAAVADR